MMRAMLMEFPDDPACDALDRQYMLGGSLLVAPVFTEDGSVDYYLPAGKWTHLLSGEVQEGARWHRATHGFLSLPLFVRPGTVLAWGAHDDRPDYALAEGVTFRVYELADGSVATSDLPAADGSAALRVTVRRTGATLDVSVEGATVPAAWKLQWIGQAAVSASAGATVAADPLGAIVTAPASARTLRVTLRS